MLALLLLLPAPATAHDVRATGTCGRGASMELRTREHDGAIEVELRVRRHRNERWSVALIHERRVAWRGGATTHGDGFRIRRSIPNYPGADAISARATNLRGLTCQATAVVRSV